MRTFILATIIGLSNLARGQPGSIEVSAAWGRATAGSSPGGAFMTIVNTGRSDDRVIAASSTVARTAELHETKEENGLMKMTPVPALEIKAGTRVTLAPGGFHIMQTGLKTPFKQGESFPLVLTFDKAGTVNVTVEVEKPGAMTGGMDMNLMNSVGASVFSLRRAARLFPAMP